uniref:Protein TsetseEP domain-containing protein n=1 Tax=Musca domestica TaxID=7370 RepID=A0A1I8MPN2_MUSDO
MISVKSLAFLALLLVVKAQQNTGLVNYYNTENSSLIRNDEYIEAVRRQNDFHIWYNTLQIETFRNGYLDRINTISIQKKSLAQEICRINEYLVPLTVLSDFSRQCVQKYKQLIPSEAAAESSMERCMITGRGQVNSLITNMVATNRSLSNYYVGNFEKGVTNCRTKFNTSYPVNYTHCLADVVSASNAYTISNQKTFSTQLETAKGSSNVYVKQAHECSFSVQNSTITNIQRATTLIDNCLNDIGDKYSNCPNKGYYCENVVSLPSYMIDYKNRTMPNPFLGRNGTEKCLTLDIMYAA